jgi:hypothetical protein
MPVDNLMVFTTNAKPGDGIGGFCDSGILTISKACFRVIAAS